MPLAARLSSSSLRVAPGSSVTTELTVTNNSAVVDELTFQVLGPAAAWTRVEPDRVPLFPRASATVSVVFAPPPGSGATVGVHDFGVRVISREDSAGSAVEEGTIEVLAQRSSQIEIVPRSSRGRSRATHDLAFDNHGNAPEDARWTARSADNTLLFGFSPDSLIVEPGDAGFTELKVRPRQRLWRGAARPHSFTVGVDGSADGRAVDAVFIQQPMIGPFLWRIVATAAAGLLVLGLLYKTVLQPSVRSSAREAAIERFAPVEAEVKAVAQAAGLTPQDVSAAARDLGLSVAPAPLAGGASSGGSTGGGSATGNFAAGGGSAGVVAAIERRSVSKRFAPVVQPAGTGIERYEVLDGVTLSLTDLVLQNPFADEGILRVLRNDEVLVESSLASFRDLDYHFVTGVEVGPRQAVEVRVDCQNAETECRSSVLLLGQETGFAPLPTTTTTTIPPTTTTTTTTVDTVTTGDTVLTGDTVPPGDTSQVSTTVGGPDPTSSVAAGPPST